MIKLLWKSEEKNLSSTIIFVTKLKCFEIYGIYIHIYIYKGVYKQISYINQEIGNFSLVNYKFLDFNKQLAKTNDNNKKVFLSLFF